MLDSIGIKDTAVIWEIGIVTSLIYVLFLLTLHNNTQKTYYTLFVLFFFVYSGIGVGYIKGVAPEYKTYYYIFLSTFSTAFRSFLLLTPSVGKFIAKSTSGFFNGFINDKRLVYVVFAVYFFAALIPLMFPKFELYKLLSPPAPDIAAEFKSRFTGEYDQPIRKIAANVTYVLYPFYLMGLYNYRRKLLTLIILLALPLYLNYCLVSYAGRSEIISVLIIFFSILWFYNQHLRRYLILTALVFIPILFAFTLYYSAARAGEKAKTATSVNEKASNLVIFIETSFPTFSRKVFSKENNFNIKQYYTWLVTLPIPKVLIGKVEAASPGAEISEVLLGKKAGTRGYFILLTGLVTESVYMYGKTFFFIHAIVIALIISLLSRLTEGNPALFSLMIVYALLMSYNLNRAGLVAPIAIVINQFFSFYLIILFLMVRRLIGPTKGG